MPIVRLLRCSLSGMASAETRFYTISDGDEGEPEEQVEDPRAKFMRLMAVLDVKVASLVRRAMELREDGSQVAALPLRRKRGLDLPGFLA